MLLVARHDRQLHLGLGEVDVHPLAVVLDVDDVAALGRHELEQLQEPTGAVGDVGAHDEVAAGRRQRVTHHGHQQGGVDVAARQERADVAAASRLARQQSGDAGGARTLDDELRALEQKHDRLRDLVVLDVDDVVEQLVEDRHRQRARMLDGDPVGDRVAGRSCRPGRRPACSRAGGCGARSRCPTRGRRRRSAGGRSRRPAALRRARGRSFPGPAITVRSSNACRKVAPVRSTLACASAIASSKPAPASTVSRAVVPAWPRPSPSERPGACRSSP